MSPILPLRSLAPAGPDPLEKLTPKQFADEWLISVRTLYEYIAQGRIPARRCGRTIRLIRGEADAAWQSIKQGSAE